MSADVGDDVFSNRYSVACLGRLVYCLTVLYIWFIPHLIHTSVKAGIILPMHNSEAEKIQETILALLQSSILPLTATELRVRLRVRAVRLAEYEVLRVLRSLRTEGLVYLEQGRWRTVSAFIPRLIPDPLAQQTRVRDRLSIQGATLLPAARSTTTTALPLPQSEVLHDVSQSKEQVPTAAKPMDFS